ncbi:MAG: hypothetical protein QM756_43650 [Polyangiaceae bacterium]
MKALEFTIDFWMSGPAFEETAAMAVEGLEGIRIAIQSGTAGVRLRRDLRLR